MRRRLAAHLHWYNHGRTYHALGGLLVPADRHYGYGYQSAESPENAAGAVRRWPLASGRRQLERLIPQ